MNLRNLTSWNDKSFKNKIYWRELKLLNSSPPKMKFENELKGNCSMLTAKWFGIDCLQEVIGILGAYSFNVSGENQYVSKLYSQGRYNQAQIC